MCTCVGGVISPQKDRNKLKSDHFLKSKKIFHLCGTEKKKVKSVFLLSNEKFGYFGKWHWKTAALKLLRKNMRCTCMLLPPSVVNCLSTSLAIQLSLLYFTPSEDAKKSCLALSPSLHRYKHRSPRRGFSSSTVSLGPQ